jgi:hypothetical protein
VQELTAFPRPLYGATLNYFLQLLLVSRCFHRILTLYIRVDGIPVRKRLLDLQMQRLINFLEFGSGHYKQISGIRTTCGYVWGNPGSPSLIFKLFVEERYQASETAFFHMCLLPKLFEKENLTTVEDKEETFPLAPRSARNKMGHRPELGDPIHNKTYKINTWRCRRATTIEFEVGRCKFPFRLPDRTTMGYESVKGEWIGISILSFKESITASPWEVGEKTFNGEEGRYWLWCLRIRILIDYVTSIAMDADGARFEYRSPISEDELWWQI